MNIGYEIKSLRKKKGLTQSELAKKCDLSKNAIWNYENNKRDPTVKTLNKIGEVLGVDLGYLIVKPLKMDEETAEKLHELGYASEVMKNVEIDKETQLIEFNKFLAAANLPFDIPFSELEILYENVIEFLTYEFYKLGYVRVSDTNEDESK
ncbi:helix-turn-helix transcriptional regulator [Clostridium tertium]|uniref:helix-turn-helix domain-containing protein n=1 Tax=Clostridium tertium TaxID=1559 RepID=UPI002A8058AD|nr:helix-turn-helix transcriptional regulator [Clostridium tertium]MDY4604311.1 helix-turn-helix transcriptional regulator [Clostridium tertium]